MNNKILIDFICIHLKNAKLNLKLNLNINAVKPNKTN